MPANLTGPNKMKSFYDAICPVSFTDSTIEKTDTAKLLACSDKQLRNSGGLRLVPMEHC